MSSIKRVPVFSFIISGFLCCGSLLASGHFAGKVAGADEQPGLNQSVAADVAVKIEASKELTVKNAWIRKTLPVQKTSALYFLLVNQSSENVELKKVSISVAPRTMIHQTVVEQGIAKMRHADNLVAVSGSHLELKPGGLHVMLMGLTGPLETDEKIPFTLHFANGLTLHSIAKVR